MNFVMPFAGGSKLSPLSVAWLHEYLAETYSLCNRYPCEKSAVNPEHLRLFDLAGRLFGRTVFEGIVADLPFANFCEDCS
jgi:hypothetical protein